MKKMTKRKNILGYPSPEYLKKEKERREQELREIGPWWWEILKRIFAL